VRQYAATPHVAPAECVVCGRPLLPRRTGVTAVAGERARAVGGRPPVAIKASTLRSETHS
jgi:hypothetical protein